MAGKIDYKQKYEELKAKFMSSVDSAWQDGYQHGLQDSQVEQAAQQQQEADQMAMAANGQPPMGQPGEESGVPGEAEQSEAPQSQNPNGDELDQHISKLEGLLGKAEINPIELGDLKKTLSDIRSLQVQINLTKSLESIKNTKLRPLNKSISFTPKTKANLPEPARKALTLQEKIVGDIFAKWEKDEQKAASDIGSILNIEGITKKG
jgi:hypothetical protein